MDFKKIIKKLLRPLMRPLLLRISAIIREETTTIIARHEAYIALQLNKKQKNLLDKLESRIVHQLNAKNKALLEKHKLQSLNMLNEKQRLANEIDAKIEKAFHIGSRSLNTQLLPYKLEKQEYKINMSRNFQKLDKPYIAYISSNGTEISHISALSNHFSITENIYVDEYVKLFSDVQLNDDLFSCLSILVSKSAIQYKSLVERIKKCDFLVINGEGYFNFHKLSIKDLVIYFVLQACKDANKPSYVLNSMISMETIKYKNMNQLPIKQIAPMLESVEVFAVKDRRSLRFIEQINKDINVRLIPDLLFGWYQVLQDKNEYMKNILKYHKYKLPLIEDVLFHSEMDFSHPYVLLGVDLSNACNSAEVPESFSRLVASLRDYLMQYGIYLYLFEHSDKDIALRKVSVLFEVPLIPSSTNVYLTGYLLGNAACYVSGCHYSSFIAAMGGTSCIFLSTAPQDALILQRILGMPYDEHLFNLNSINDDEIKKVISAIEKLLLESFTSREQLKKTCKRSATKLNNSLSLIKNNINIIGV